MTMCLTAGYTVSIQNTVISAVLKNLLGVMKMKISEKIYVFLSVIMFAVLTAVNIESNWRFLEVEGIAAMLWIMVELICGLIRDFTDIVRENEEERHG